MDQTIVLEIHTTKALATEAIVILVRVVAGLNRTNDNS